VFLKERFYLSFFVFHILIVGMISCGDIVKRRERLGRMVKGGPKDASLMFYDGYFLVVSIIENRMPCVNSKNNTKIVRICRIMNCFGQFSWISEKLIKKIDMS
jgi:hypothetical protein